MLLILLEFQGDRQLTEKVRLPFLGPQLLLWNPSSDYSADFSPVLVEPMLQVKPPWDFAMRICNNSWRTLKNQGIHITLVLWICIYISERITKFDPTYDSLLVVTHRTEVSGKEKTRSLLGFTGIYSQKERTNSKSVVYMVVLVDYQYWQFLGGSLAFRYFRLRYGMMQQKHSETIEMLDLQLIGGRDMPINCKDRLDVGINIVTLVDVDNKTIPDLWYDAPEKKHPVLIEVETVL